MRRKDDSMIIPKYVQEMLNRSTYDYDFAKHPHYSAGYTIRIPKPTIYTLIPTFKKDVERLVAWCNRVSPSEFEDIQTAYVLFIPASTHYRKQYAIVTIYDGLMQKIEHLIQANAE